MRDWKLAVLDKQSISSDLKFDDLHLKVVVNFVVEGEGVNQGKGVAREYTLDFGWTDFHVFTSSKLIIPRNIFFLLS